MLDAAKSVLLVVDVQGKLARMMHRADELMDNLARIIKGAGVLEVPVICTEQNPRGLGPTVAELAPIIKTEPLAKRSFSCCGEPLFLEALNLLGRTQVLLAGIEAHVCIYQTAVDLLGLGYEVHVLTDAISSRKDHNRQTAIGRMARAGAELTSVETALFEMLRVAEGEKFKQILQIVK